MLLVRQNILFCYLFFSGENKELRNWKKKEKTTPYLELSKCVVLVFGVLAQQLAIPGWKCFGF